jgi:hypothetical protein
VGTVLPTAGLAWSRKACACAAGSAPSRMRFAAIRCDDLAHQNHSEIGLPMLRGNKSSR